MSRRWSARAVEGERANIARAAGRCMEVDLVRKVAGPGRSVEADAARAQETLALAIDRLIPAVADGNAKVRGKALEVLRRYGKTAVDRMILALKGTADDRFRLALIAGLAVVGVTYGMTVLRAFNDVLAVHPDEAHRQAATESLTAIMRVEVAAGAVI